MTYTGEQLRDYMRNYRARLKGTEPPEHGTLNGFDNYSCRCGECSEAKQIYAVWCSMRHRCSNPADDMYQYYGERGITVCERWLNSFEAFKDDMGPRPEGFMLDRVNNDGNYDPSNVRWVSAKVSARNRRPRKRRVRVRLQLALAA